LQKDGGAAMALPGDVTDAASMEAACTKLTEAYGTIDILVNAAGGNQAGATIGPDQSFCSTFDTAAFDQVAYKVFYHRRFLWRYLGYLCVCTNSAAVW
jgi:NAD(P)-dependent dehydrogenase (short-subunit alcohol dehydrogenase family)